MGWRSTGHYVQGTSAPAAIDRGTVYVTNQRVIFQGAKQTRECLWGKLISARNDDAIGRTAFAVSNRQKPLVLQYGPQTAPWFVFRLSLALAHYRHEVPVIVTQLEDGLAELDARKPRPPAG